MHQMLLTTLIVALSAAGSARAGDETLFAERTIKFTGGDYVNETFRYRLLQPPEVVAGREYPLVLFLHGAGERGTDNELQLLYLPKLMESPAYRRRFPCFMVVPQCREDRQWVDVPWGELESRPLRPEPTAQLQMALQILERSLDELPVDRRRVYLTGLSMGGYGAWELAMRRPDLFAAVAPICGGGDESQAARLADLPVWAAHGDADRVVPVERTRRMIAAIEAAGGEPYYTEYIGVGHNSWTPAYSDLNGIVAWMFQQARADDE